MKHSDRSKRSSGLGPIKKVELSDRNTTLRMVLIVGLLAVGMTALMIGLFGVLNTEPGWQIVEANPGDASCSQDFVLNYDFTEAGASASSKHKELIRIYSDAAVHAYRIFNGNLREDGLFNLRYLNDHPNQPVTVDPVLHEALELVQRFGNRSIYLAPVYVEYNRIFLCEDEGDAAAFDPGQNPELVDYIAELASFGSDPQLIDLQILEDDQVCLFVSDAYLSYAATYEIDTFVDFGWMRNAFVADYLAEVLSENGFTSGYLASYDGFTRNLDDRGLSYAFNIFDRRGNDINLPAVMTYDTPMSIVFLRSYPMTEQDRWHYFAFSNGRIVTPFLDPKDGMSKASVDSLVSYSPQMGCSELLLQMIPVFVSDDFSSDPLLDMVGSQAYSVWCEGNTVCYSQENAAIALKELQSGEPYDLAFAKFN